MRIGERLRARKASLMQAGRDYTTKPGATVEALQLGAKKILTHNDNLLDGTISCGSNAWTDIWKYQVPAQNKLAFGFESGEDIGKWNTRLYGTAGDPKEDIAIRLVADNHDREDPTVVMTVDISVLGTNAYDTKYQPLGYTGIGAGEDSYLVMQAKPSRDTELVTSRMKISLPTTKVR